MKDGQPTTEIFVQFITETAEPQQRQGSSTETETPHGKSHIRRPEKISMLPVHEWIVSKTFDEPASAT